MPRVVLSGASCVLAGAGTATPPWRGRTRTGTRGRIAGKLSRLSGAPSLAVSASTAPSARLASLRDVRVPKAFRERFEEICALTDRFCAERLDAEYAELCRKLVAKLARKRPSPLERGDPRIWAAAALYTVGSLNFIFDREQELHVSGDELSALTGVPKSTIANKAKAIRDLLGLHRLDPELCRRELLDRHPFAWLVEVDGVIVDARRLPAPLQDEARRRGLIPDLPEPTAAVSEAA